MKNKRGDFTGLLFLLATISVLAIFLLVLGYVTPLINDELITQIGISEEINGSFIASNNVAANTFPVIWMVVFAGLMLGVFATAWFIPTHPIFFPFFVILLVVAVLVSIALSNAYEELTNNITLQSTSLQQQAIAFLMFNLPYVAVILGIIVLILSFAKPSNDFGLPG
jgi:hypothetical protein|tara:strand:- start:5437 stop:5940 length:504 start_codon:yes stop_codon:yes gene_type:complete